MRVFLMLELLEDGVPAEIVQRLPEGMRTHMAGIRAEYLALTPRERRKLKYRIFLECYSDLAAGLPDLKEAEDIWDAMGLDAGQGAGGIPPPPLEEGGTDEGIPPIPLEEGGSEENG